MPPDPQQENARSDRRCIRVKNILRAMGPLIAAGYAIVRYRWRMVTGGRLAPVPVADDFSRYASEGFATTLYQRAAGAEPGDPLVQLEQRVRDSEAHLHSLINSMPAVIAFVDAERRCVYANELYRQRFSHGDDITGRTVADILGPQRYAVVAPMVERVLQGEPQSYDWEPFPGLWESVRYEPKRDSDGRILGYYVIAIDMTRRHQTEEALRASEQRLARVLEGADQGYWDWNLQTNAFTVSARWETMLGYEPGEMDVRVENWPQLVHPDDLAAAQVSIERHLRGDAPLHESEFRAKTKTGEWRWILTRGRIVQRDSEGQPLMMSGTHTDVHDRKLLELAQRDAAVVFDSSYDGILVTDAKGHITKVNPAFSRITGYSPDEVLHQNPRLLSSGLHDQRFYQTFWQALNTEDVWHGEMWNRRKGGDVYAALQSVSAVRDFNGKVRHYVSVFSDISVIKAHQAQLDRVANYDPLTDLPNRRLLHDRLHQGIARSVRSGKAMAVCFIDLDGFKDINDRYGHEVGDALLVGVARCISADLRAEDTLARLGGDEFVLLLTEVASPQECATILERLLNRLRQPLAAGEHVLNVTASIGVSLYPHDNADPDTLLRHADQAMYLAKQAGKNVFQMFDLESDRQAQRHREVLVRLEQALHEHEFELHYQPKVDWVVGAVVGVEALIRWHHPERGLLPPAEFLPQLTGTELELALGDWVIETAITQAECWAAQGLRLPVSINVSAQHLLSQAFEDRLKRLLDIHPGVAPADLELEVLETAAIHDMSQAIAVMARCRALGVSFALDDFGTGYSSLTYLRKLPVQTLKIDQSFVRDMLNDPDDLGIVQAVIELAHAFGRSVIAEGVETCEHGQRLRELGCRLGQGYGIAKPMPADHLPDWCADWPRRGWVSAA